MQVAVSGLGLTTGLGRTFDQFWRQYVSGRSAVSRVTRFDSSNYRSHTAVELKDPVIGNEGSIKRDFVRTAISEALASAKMGSVPPDATFIVCGQFPQDLDSDGGTDNPEQSYRSEFATPDGESLGYMTSGSNIFVTQACASASIGLLAARELLAAGFIECAIVIGGCSLNPYEFAGFDALRGLSKGQARPFDRARDGIMIGEGAGALVLETIERARAREHLPLAIVIGGAYRISDSSEVALDSAAVYDCMGSALEDAGVDNVDYIHAHATGTPQGDAAELAALEHVAKSHKMLMVPVASHKGAVGHLLHAAAFPGFAAAIGFLRTNIAPGTVGLMDPEITDNILLLTRAVRLPSATHALVNAFGFSGNMSSVIFERCNPD